MIQLPSEKKFVEVLESQNSSIGDDGVISSPVLVCGGVLGDNANFVGGFKAMYLCRFFDHRFYDTKGVAHWFYEWFQFAPGFPKECPLKDTV